MAEVVVYILESVDIEEEEDGVRNESITLTESPFNGLENNVAIGCASELVVGRLELEID